MIPGTTLDVGDKVFVGSDGPGNYSGIGEVTEVDGDWITVKPLHSQHPGWICEWDFGRSRVTPLPLVSPRTEPGRHPNSERFHELAKLIPVTHDAKQADYGRGDDPFANVRASEEWGVPGWQGAMIRLNDKVRRLQSLAQNGRLENEAANDSFLDIAVYALIAWVLHEQEADAA